MHMDECPLGAGFASGSPVYHCSVCIDYHSDFRPFLMVIPRQIGKPKDVTVIQSGRAETVSSDHLEYLPGSSGLLPFGLFSGPFFFFFGS